MVVTGKAIGMYMPLKLSIDRFLLKYCNHLLALPENSLAKQAFSTGA